MTQHRTIVQAVTATVVLVFAIGIWATGGAVSPTWLRFYSAAVLLATLLLGVWEHWLWRLPLSQRIASVPRDIRGTWKGKLESLWKDPATGESPPAKSAYLVVRQSASQVVVRLLTEESSSQSTLAKVAKDDASSTLAYVYLNRPDIRVEHRSRMHNGSAFLEISGKPASRLRGRYWTDRDSRGELDFDQRSEQLADDFREAGALFVHRAASPAPKLGDGA